MPSGNSLMELLDGLVMMLNFIPCGLNHIDPSLHILAGPWLLYKSVYGPLHAYEQLDGPCP
jgi:hypothetical protein